VARTSFRALATAAVIVIVSATGCGASCVSRANTAVSSPPATQTSPTAASPSACATLGGTVDSGHGCRFHSVTSQYMLDFNFPTAYPDQQALADAVMQERDTFVDWVSEDTPLHPYELDILGDTYQSGTPASGTRSLVLTIGSDAGMHPVTTYRSLNFDLEKHTPITFNTLFKPGTNPLNVLNPIVQRHIDEHGGPGAVSLNDIGIKAYLNFAITDDAVTFFFNQDGLLEHTAGPLKVSVTRTDIASLLA
jgi:hypothetical protein